MELPQTFDNGVTIESVVMDSGKYNDESGSTIDLQVKFAAFAEILPFTASPLDGEAHGRALYAAAKDGYFGGIRPYAATADQMNQKVQSLSDEATAKITALQNEVNTLQDAVDMEMAEPEEEARLPLAKTELTNWKKYRILLSRVPAQAGFPTKIDWPVKPA